MIPDFLSWLKEQGMDEEGLRTALGIYPPAYGSGQYPPLYFAPILAAHQFAFARIHGDEHPELLNKKIRDEFKKHPLGKKHKNGKKHKAHDKKDDKAKKSHKKTEDKED